jgi:hypothetical protein
MESDTDVVEETVGDFDVLTEREPVLLAVEVFVA